MERSMFWGLEIDNLIDAWNRLGKPMFCGEEWTNPFFKGDV